MFGDKAKKRVYIGSDHAGFKVKEDLREYVGALGGYEITDLGCFNEDPCDYPDIAREVGEKVVEVEDAQGILICGTGVGMAMAANKLRGVRAAVAMNPHVAEMSRKHNNANILVLAAREQTEAEMKEVIDKFLATEFESGEERHVRRVNKIDGV